MRKRERVQVFSEGESMTKQEFMVDCDINLIVRKYEASGILSHLNKGKPQYVDNTNAVDLQTQMNMVMEAEAQFGNLPAAVRDAADNDPVRLLEMLDQEEGARVLEEAGMQLNLPERPAEETGEVPPTQTPVADGSPAE